MRKVNILRYAAKTANGDLPQTIAAMKSGKVNISKTMVVAQDMNVEIPYFLFQDEVKDNPQEIYQVLRDLVCSVIEGLKTEQKAATAIIVGTSIIDWYSVHAVEDTIYKHKRQAYASQKKGIDSYAQELAYEFGLHDFTMTVSTACTSSANALLEGANLIKADLFEHVLVIGVEIFSELMSSGFNSMRLLSGSEIKPFDQNRDGLVLGEGVAVALLGSDDSPWCLRGGFSNCDSQTITSVSQSGDEYLLVMQNALKLLSLRAQEITALKTHATGTLANDLSEINAIRKLFTNDLIFTALKPYIGHTLGACGVLEMVLLMGSVDEGFLPKTLSCEIPIIQGLEPIKKHLTCKEGVFMLNYFGFGGNNTSLVIEKRL